MKKNVDLIKGLALRIEQNYSYKRRDRKLEQQLFKKITDNFNKIILQSEDEIFV